MYDDRIQLLITNRKFHHFPQFANQSKIADMVIKCRIKHREGVINMPRLKHSDQCLVLWFSQHKLIEHPLVTVTVALTVAVVVLTY